MENLICPSCMGDFGVKSGMTGTNAHTCPLCGDCYVVMYAAGFTDGVRTSKVEPAKQSAPPNNTQSSKLFDKMERFAIECDVAGNRKDAREVRLWIKQLRTFV